MNLYQNFNGTIDELLSHVLNTDPQQLQDELNGTTNVILTDQEAIDCLKEDYHVDDETANEILKDLKLEETFTILNKLERLGLVEFSSYDEDGKPDKVKLTEYGKKIVQSYKTKDNE